MFYLYPFKNAEEQLKLSVWEKAKIIYLEGRQYDPRIWRWDVFGNIIKFTDHGKIDSRFGWEIDHILPVSKGGTDIFSNLQPLYWQNNREKGDKYPWPIE